MDVSAFITVDPDSGRLGLLSRDRPKCLLPLAGKPLLVHTIEDVTMAGIRQVTILAGKHAAQVRAVLNDGRRWGIDITVVGCHEPGESDVWRDGQSVLIVRGDMARTPVLGRFLAWTEGRTEGRLSVSLGGKDAGIQLVRPGRARYGEMLCDGAVSAIASPADFHAANLGMVAGHYPGMLVEGRVALDEAGDELIVGRGSRVHPDSLVEGKALIGAFTQVARSVQLSGHVVIGRDCIIEPGTTIRNCVIMPGTYVGADLDVCDMIVSGNTLIQVETGAITEIADPFLLASLNAV